MRAVFGFFDMMGATHQSFGPSCPISSNEREKGHPCLGQRSADESPWDCWVSRERVSLLGFVAFRFPPYGRIHRSKLSPRLLVLLDVVHMYFWHSRDLMGIAIHGAAKARDRECLVE